MFYNTSDECPECKEFIGTNAECMTCREFARDEEREDRRQKKEISRATQAARRKEA